MLSIARYRLQPLSRGRYPYKPPARHPLFWNQLDCVQSKCRQRTSETGFHLKIKSVFPRHGVPFQNQNITHHAALRTTSWITWVYGHLAIRKCISGHSGECEGKNFIEVLDKVGHGWYSTVVLPIRGCVRRFVGGISFLHLLYGYEALGVSDRLRLGPILI